MGIWKEVNIFISVNLQNFKMNMGEINIYLRNINGLNSPTTICRLDEGIKIRFNCFLSQETSPSRVKRNRERMAHCIPRQTESKASARAARLRPEKTDREVKAIKRDKEGHCILIKKTTHQKDKYTL